MVANILPTDTSSTQGVGSKGQTIYFSESSRVTYQIKDDDAGSNMVANILPTDTPSTQGVGSKGQTIYFSESSRVAVIIFHFEGMSFSSAHDLKQWDFLDNNEIFSEFAQFIRQHILTILTIKQLVADFPNLIKLAQLALTSAVHTAGCERGFSAQNAILTKGRNRLLVENQHKLMRVKMTADIDYEQVIQIWRQKNRRLYKAK